MDDKASPPCESMPPRNSSKVRSVIGNLTIKTIKQIFQRRNQYILAMPVILCWMQYIYTREETFNSKDK